MADAAWINQHDSKEQKYRKCYDETFLELSIQFRWGAFV